MINSFKLLLFIVFLFPVSLKAQLPFSIEGEFNTDLLGDDHSFSIRDGDLAILSFIHLARKDTVLIKDKRFKIEGEVAVPAVAMLNIKLNLLNGGFGSLVLLDSSVYDIEYSQEEVDNEKVQYHTEINTTSSFYNLWKSLNLKVGALNAKKEELAEKIEKSTSDYERVVFEEESDVVEKELSEIFYKASKEYAGTYEMAYILPNAPDFSYERYIGFYNELPDEVKESPFGINLYNRLMMVKNES